VAQLNHVLGRLRLSMKLAVMLAIPVIALIAFSAIQIKGKASEASQLGQLGELSELAVTTSALLHETQKERGITALYMGSGGTEHGDKLATQRDNVDARLADLDAALSATNVDSFGSDFAAAVSTTSESFGELSSHRSSVDQLSIPTGDAIAFYTQWNTAMLSTVEEIGGLSNNAELSRLIASYVNWMQGKERAGQERAVLSNTFAAGSFQGAFFNKFSQLVSEQNTYQQVFASFATPEQSTFAEQTVQGSEVDSVNEMREIAFAGSTSTDLGVDAGFWFDSSTVMINHLKTVEDQLASDLITTASDLKSSAQSSLYILAGVVVALIAFSVASAYVIARLLSSQVTQLAEGLSTVAVGDVTYQIDIESTDEVGEMADSYRQMQTYLGEMVGAAQQIADGDLTARVQPRGDNDALGNAFQSMIANLVDLIGTTSNTANKMVMAKDELAGSAEQAAIATQEVAKTTGGVAEGTSQQAQSVQDIHQNVEQLLIAIGQVADGAEEQSKSTEEAGTVGSQVASAADSLADAAKTAAEHAGEAAETAENGAKMVDDTIAGIGRIKESIDHASEEISQLGERSQEIGKIVAVIEDIAAQTNLLALNAAIEAARAGEQGRGFAVVADEVRQLAERVASATKEIATLIGGVQDGVDASVKAMEEGATEMDSGSQVAAQAGEALAQILSAAKSVAEQIRSMASNSDGLRESGTEMIQLLDNISEVVERATAATAEMQATANTVNEAVESIASVAESNSSATEQVSAAAEEMTAQVEEVSAATNEFGRMAEDLQQQVSRFRLSESGSDSATDDEDQESLAA
jgi:methyl-accepting chemotaxis protein